jgi:tetratricopeptide (TPR) repeat protein
LGAPLLLVAVGAAVYANSLAGVFLFDDDPHIVQNPVIRQVWPLSRLIRSWPSRPLLPVSLAMNYALGGLDVTGYHVFNIAVHLAAALTLYGLVRRTLRLPCLEGCFAGSAEAISLVTALVWLVHPLQTQAVTYVVQRCESMMGLFFLLTLYAYLRGATASSRGRSWTWYAVAFQAYCLGLASKEVMVTVVPVLWLYDRSFLASSWRELIRRRGWLHLAFLVPLAAAATILIPGALAAGATVGFGVAAVSPWEYARSQPGVLLHYLRLAVWPDALCLDYCWPIENRWALGIIVPGVVIPGLLGLSVWALWRGWRVGFLGVAFFLVLAPTSSIMPFRDLCFEHRMYLPLAAPAIGLTLAGYELWRRLRTRSGRDVAPWWLPAGTIGVTAVMVTALGLATARRNRDYCDAQAMWADTVRKAPHNPRAMTNLGRALAERGKLEDAIRLYHQAIAQPSYLKFDHQASFLLGNAYVAQGRFEDARTALATAVRLKEDFAEAFNNLGYTCRKLGDHESAEEYCRRAVTLKPGYAGAYLNLGLALRDAGRRSESLECLQKAAELEPDDGPTQYELGVQWSDQGNMGEAIRCWEAAVRKAPNLAGAHGRLAEAFRRQGSLDKAAAHGRTAVQLQPDDAEARLELGLTLARCQHWGDAQQELKQAVALDPQSLTARLALADLSLVRQQWHTALATYRAAESLDANDCRPAVGIANALAGSGDWAAAERNLREAIQRRPEAVELHAQLARLLLDRNQAEEACVHFERAMKLGCTDVTVWLAYGMALERRGDRTKAVDVYRQLVDNNPTLVPARLNLAACMSQVGDHQGAVAQMREVLRLAPNHAGAHNNLGNVLAKLNRINEAVACYRRALEINPAFAPARDNLDRVLRTLRR